MNGEAQNWTQYSSCGHLGRVEGKENLFRPANHSPSSLPQDAIGLLGHKGTMLAHGQPTVHWDPQVSFSYTALQQVSPNLFWYLGCCSYPDASLCTCPCYILLRFSLPNPPACLGLAGWQHSLQACQTLTVLCHEQLDSLCSTDQNSLASFL